MKAPLAGAFVPVFTQYMKDEGEDRAWVFANRVLTFLSVFLFVLVSIGILGILLALQFDLSERLRDVLFLSAILLPYMFFICNVGLLMGILNAFYHFFLPAFNPVILNVVLISVMGCLTLTDLFTVRTKIIFVCSGFFSEGFCSLLCILLLL